MGEAAGIQGSGSAHPQDHGEYRLQQGAARVPPPDQLADHDPNDDTGKQIHCLACPFALAASEANDGRDGREYRFLVAQKCRRKPPCDPGGETALGYHGETVPQPPPRRGGAR
ncbi:hypothetical protein GCM10025778_21820 [Paeniglutamicibacter antarcticus]|uniref:Uncharacterized protein n=1 Tax=Paeniglutamicibacter antarcticus TaxID=494023 RepID=A0ABP9TRE0_9MICC